MTTHLAVAIDAAKHAGAYLRTEFQARRRAAYSLKGRQDLVTAQDRRAERMILSRLHRRYAQYDSLSEEGGVRDRASESYEWFVDPIDGTSNFIARIPFFCVAIGLIRNGEPALGVIYQPITDELFTVVSGHGAKLNGRRLHVSSVTALDEAYVSLCYGHQATAPYSYRRQMTAFPKFKADALKVRIPGSGSLSLAYVAAGRYEASVNFPRQEPWDMAVGSLLVREAGGTVTAIDGTSWSTRANSILATNGKVHRKLLRALAR